jgi:hypothetical protein
VLQACPVSPQTKKGIVIDEICETIAVVLQPGVCGIAVPGVAALCLDNK